MAFVQVGSAGSLPTFFEMVAAERLMPSLKAAVVYALSVYSQNRPNLRHLLQHEDELFFLVNVLLDRYSLQQSNASFAESLYALHRIPRPAAELSSGSNATPTRSTILTPSQRASSLMLLSLVPYLRAKLDAAYLLSRTATGAAAARSTSSPPQSSSSSISTQILQDFFVSTYPFLSSFHEAARFVYQLFYLLGRSPYFSPELHLLGLVVARMSGQDVAALEKTRQDRLAKRTELANRATGGAAMRAIRQGWVRLSSTINTHTRSALILAVFGYKLLEWWYTSAEQKLGGQQAFPPPPPPPAPLPSPQGVRLPENKSLCPLCKRTRTNPAMIPTSGYVFCYPCAFKFVDVNGCCPVTRIPARVDQIRRLYLGEA